MTQPPTDSTLLGRAEQAWANGDGPEATALFDRAFRRAESEADVSSLVTAVLGLARGQQYNLIPGLLPVRLHAAYDLTSDPASRSRLAAALARCWAYANEPRRAAPFATTALALADDLDDPELQADALDAVLAAHWGPDDLGSRREWALRLGDVSAHLGDPDVRLQGELWGLTVAWEVLDLPRMHRSMRAIELLAEQSPRAEFFAASRRLALELLRGNVAAATALIERAEAAGSAAVIPDAYGVVYSMRGYSAYFAGDAGTCAELAPAFEDFAAEQGVVVVRAEAAMIWLGARRLDKVSEMVGAFTPAVLAGLARDSDWLLTLQCVLEGAIAVSDREVLATAVKLLEPYAGRSVVNAGAVMWHGVTDDTLARALTLLGDADAATRYRAAALSTYDRLGATWWRDRLRDTAASSADGAADPPAAPRERVVHLHEQAGGLWVVGQQGATFVLPPMRGLQHLNALIGHPGTELSALELVGHAETVAQSGLDVLDDRARAAYRARLARLDVELASSDRVDLHQERDAIKAQLAGATGLGGRSRRTGSHDERARVAVRKAVVAALARIADTDPWLARHLHNRVRTGSHCRYDADPDQRVTWVLR